MKSLFTYYWAKNDIYGHKAVFTVLCLKVFDTDCINSIQLYLHLWHLYQYDQQSSIEQLRKNTTYNITRR